MDTAAAGRMSKGLKAVSDVNRIRILGILVHGEYCVSDLVARLGIDQPKVSHHLAILRQAGIIRCRRQGRHINYSVVETCHRRDGDGVARVDVFDLGGLSVAFRFEAAATARPRTPGPDGHRVVDPRRDLGAGSLPPPRGQEVPRT